MQLGMTYQNVRYSYGAVGLCKRRKKETLERLFPVADEI